MFRNFYFFLQSFAFFFNTFFVKRRYDIVFYYPQHFNRGSDSVNHFFVPLIDTCKRKRIKYLMIEEPDYNCIQSRDKDAVYFDFIFLLIVFLRGLFSFEQDVIERDKKIGRLLSKLYLINISFDNFITISQSMLSVFNGISPKSSFYDLQHGIIYNNKLNYILNNQPNRNLVDNYVRVLLFGQFFQNLLIANDKTDYFKQHSSVLGYLYPNIKTHQCFNNNVLVTLQFTQDHSEKENTILLRELELFINSESSDIIFYLKNHPRFDKQVDLSKLLELDNVMCAPEDIQECFELCSIHATTYSSSVFEASILGIPTVFIHSSNDFDFFNIDFKYPLDYDISSFKSEEIYQKSTKILQDWAKHFYSTYNESTFLSLLK